MKTSLARTRCQNMTWSHCEIVSPTNLVNLSEHSGSLGQIANLMKCWISWEFPKSRKVWDPWESWEPWNLGNLAEPSETFGNSWNLQESGTLRKPLEPRNPVAHCAFCAVHLSNPLSAIPLESLRLRLLWGKPNAESVRWNWLCASKLNVP